MTEHIPPEDTLAHFDHLLEGLEGEIRLSERYGIEMDSIDFYKRMLRAAYQKAVEVRTAPGSSAQTARNTNQ